MKNTQTQNLKMNFLYNSCYQILLIIIPLITTPYISRVIGPEGIGVYSYSHSIAYYFTIFILLGLNTYGSRTIASSISIDDVNINFCNIYVSQLVLGLLITCGYFFYCLRISNNRSIALIFSFFVLSAVLDINWFFCGMQQFKISVIRNSVVKILGVAAVFIFVKTDKDLYKYCLIMSGSYLLSQLILWPYLIKQVKYVSPNLKNILKHLKPNATLFLTTLAVSIFKIMDKIMLGIMSNYTEVGYYESAEKIICIPTAFIVSLGAVMLPYTTKLISEGNKENGKVINISLIFAMTITSALCFGIMSVADVFVPIFYGEGYEKCIYLFMVLMPSCLFLAFANVIRSQYLLPQKMDHEYVISAFLGAGVNLVINLLLIPQYSSIGAAVGTLIAETVVCVYQCYQCRNNLDFNVIVKQVFPMPIAGAIMMFSLRLMCFSFDSLIVVLFIKIILGAVIYFIVLAILLYLLRKNYRDLVNSIINKKSMII